jgi:hypothetical protein
MGLMNAEQQKSSVRDFLKIFGSATIGWFAAKWHLSADEQKQLLDLLMSPATIGFIVTAGAYIASLFSHTEAHAVEVVKEIAKDPTSAVAGVVTTSDVKGRELAATMNDPSVVAPAGTVSASTISKS